MSYKSNRYSKIQLTKIEQNYNMLVNNMCKTCTSWHGKCDKKRIARVCAEKGLKNK